MRVRVDPITVAVALGMLGPAALSEDQTFKVQAPQVAPPLTAAEAPPDHQALTRKSTEEWVSLELPEGLDWRDGVPLEAGLG